MKGNQKEGTPFNGLKGNKKKHFFSWYPSWGGFKGTPKEIHRFGHPIAYLDMTHHAFQPQAPNHAGPEI